MEHGEASKGRHDAQSNDLGCRICGKILDCFSKAAEKWLDEPIAKAALPTKGDYMQVNDYRLLAASKPFWMPLVKVASLLEGSCPHVDYFRNVKFDYGSVPNYERRDLDIHHSGYDTSIIFYCSDPQAKDHRSHSTTAWMDLVAKPDEHDQPGKVLMLDPQRINSNTVRGWISSCDKVHGDRCGLLPLFKHEDTIQPTYLVDTLQACLVHGKESATGYITLSYTWGKAETLRNDSSIVERLLQPGVFVEDESIVQRIPRTIKDAFAIIRHLGQRYLWVDALCIVQDDSTQLDMELSQMHRVFACANFSIIAADGADANYGLRGFKDLTMPRDLRQEPVRLAGNERMMQSTKNWANGGSSTFTDRESLQASQIYYDRAWTFQERLFSKKQLIFTKNSIQWQCQSAHWYEDILSNGNRQDKRRNLPTESWLHTIVPTLANISKLVMEFNQKALTYPEDAFPAFAGIQSMLHRTFKFGLMYGLPEMFFDIALNWHPIYPITRRKAIKTSRLTQGSHQLPSWSWIGWAGNISFPHDHDFAVDPTGVINIDGFISPVATWYTMDSPSYSSRRQIESHWHTYRSLARGEIENCPAGWRREEFNLNNEYYKTRGYERHDLPRVMPTYCYRHATFRHRPGLCWYPIPVLDPSSIQPLQTQTAFLFARTSRAFFYPEKETGPEEESTEERFLEIPPQIQLLNEQKQPVGYLQLHNRDDLANLQSPSKHPRVELVATAKGYTGRIFDFDLAQALAKATGKLPWETQLKDCYFVLWVEWEDGIAYRRGSGAVTVPAWEIEREEELVDLVLG
ncbi:MAG: hypothetical protein Q9218_008001 [Villophora microphyllina]